PDGRQRPTLKTHFFHFRQWELSGQFVRMHAQFRHPRRFFPGFGKAANPFSIQRRNIHTHLTHPFIGQSITLTLKPFVRPSRRRYPTLLSASRILVLPAARPARDRRSERFSLASSHGRNRDE